MLYIIIVTLIIVLFVSSTFFISKLNSAQVRNKIFAEETSSLKEQISCQLDQLKSLESEASSLKTEKTFLTSRLQEQKKEIETLNEKLKFEFKNIAQSILEEKSQKFTDQNKHNIENILNPLKEKIKEFQSRVEQTNKDDISRSAALKAEIIKLAELNIQITKEASALTKAIKGDNKTQGNWGELILEKILEMSGLRKGIEYYTQSSFKSEEGKILRPDIILNLPDNKSMIIDSKVSLSDYDRYTNTEDLLEQEKYLKKHLLSIRAHLKNLSEKNYQVDCGIKSLDFVLMFIPIEPAFNLAIHKDPSLYGDAYSKNIVMVSPSSLLATLKIINNLWKTEYQNNNVLEIAKQGGALYDKFVNFVQDFVMIRDKIMSLEKSYSNAGKKLYEGRDNLIRKAEKLKELGAITTKTQIPALVAKAEEQSLESHD